ncbi:hypothetical protein M2341_000992 [Sphingobium sp. B7D2B]|uniref:hypothetical protein n=1 Tax=Sphingobium sp. B7D2B TaxID=2940583 RepID=UPI0022257CB6|nr:hypothetical protein [Sphingobium sp. B7D2B]MCW2365545.1 hypothetical protein [Sphingobium sp. B7D2B]
MREGVTDWLDALSANGIRTGIMGWFDFASGPVAVWTGWTAIQPVGSGDAMLDGVRFEPLQEGIPVAIGENTYSYTGSDEMTVTLAVPSVPTHAMIAASLDPDEYRGRTAIIWRALMVTLPTTTQPAEWAFRRVRAGAMDKVVMSNNGQERLFTLTIEAHQSMITKASGSNYLDQPRLDPTDTSQDFAVSIANSPNTPTRPTDLPQNNQTARTADRFS